MDVSEAKRLKQAHAENGMLTKLLAEAMLDNSALSGDDGVQLRQRKQNNFSKNLRALRVAHPSPQPRGAAPPDKIKS
jgi:hypothetical protein